ncbi:hypothetical protein DPEC_G00111570 [Dallia pectoralis]|uniref:Uncharacterized protein n=1 Tax=Dallia pectoralis TaxID=75939 RepID=A0ACC2GT87_DALPE|nr:hypothetical protein DPEC_G00111570 [Dallia pectoralis]
MGADTGGSVAMRGISAPVTWQPVLHQEAVKFSYFKILPLLLLCSPDPVECLLPSLSLHLLLLAAAGSPTTASGSVSVCAGGSVIAARECHCACLRREASELCEGVPRPAPRHRGLIITATQGRLITMGLGKSWHRVWWHHKWHPAHTTESVGVRVEWQRSRSPVGSVSRCETGGWAPEFSITMPTDELIHNFRAGTT